MNAADQLPRARPLRPAPVVFWLAALAGLWPGRPAALAVLALAAGGVLLALLAWKTRRGAPPRGALVVAVLVAVAAAAELAVPSPSRPSLLSESTALVERRWKDLLGEMDAAVVDPPLAGGDFQWLERRARLLGRGAGISLMTVDAESLVAWSGWTTPLEDDERRQLLERLDDGPAVLVLRRGLTVRLVAARRVSGAERFIAVAEKPLPPEPDAGPLASDLDPAVRVLVRWEALGEGLRAPLETTSPPAPGGQYWSLTPLMSGGGQRAARVSLGVGAVGAGRDDARRGFAGVLVAGALALAALSGGRAALLLVPARLSLLAACPSAARWPWLHDAAPWADLASDAAPSWLARLIHTPLDSALTGLCLLGLLALAPRPVWPRARVAAAGVGAVVCAAGLWLAARAALDHGVIPVELLVPGPGALRRGLLVFALAATPAAGAALLVRALWPRLRLPLLWACALGGAVTGFVQSAAIEPAARRDAERRALPEIQNRRATWDEALRGTLQLAAPPTAPADLVPERDAIDLWWSSPLAQLELASGVWKFGPDGELEDSFLTGLPPLQPTPEAFARWPIAPPFSGHAMVGPREATLRFLGGASNVVIAELARPEGGSWVVAILDEPGNLPRTGGGSRLVSPASSERHDASPFVQAHLAWFDSSGALRGADDEATPPPPRAPPPRPRWRRATIEGRSAQVLEAPDGAGSVTLTYYSPTRLVRAALAVDRTAALAALALLLGALPVIAASPRGALRSALAALREAGARFRVQVTLALVIVGLFPLLALGVAGRAGAARQARLQLIDEANRAAHVARRLVEDYLTLASGGPPALDDEAAAWLARSIGDDLFAWREGALAATSRPDLVRAGLLPRRIAGEDWRAITVERAPLVVREPAGDRPQDESAVVHAPFRDQEGRTGVLTISLARAGRRISEGLAEVDRALLVSAVVLVLLAGALVARATRRLVRPLRELEHAASRIAGGDFNAVVPGAGFSETRALADAFRDMAVSLAEQRRSLEARRVAIETLINRMPLAILGLTADRVVFASNPSARELLGADVGRPLPGGGDVLLEAVRELCGKAGEDVRIVERAGAGGPRRFRAAGIDLPGLFEGAPARLLVVEDLTDAVRSERLAAWAEMARRIAHEIKNPLTPISLVVEHVQRLIEEQDPRWREILDRALETIADQVRVLQETAREFSDYARILVASPAPLDIPGQLNEWLAPYALAPPAGVRIVLDGPSEMQPVSADPRLLRRAVINLVDNALAAVHGGGTVIVRWASDDSPPVVRITVEDDGAGIEPARIPKLFVGGDSTRQTGSGLGLPIAQQAALAHGGHIEVDSALGRGSRFTIVLPRRDDAGGPEARPSGDGVAAPPGGLSDDT